MDLSKRIMYFCDALGITVNNLADRSGITQSTLRGIVVGESETAQLLTIERICEGLEIPLEDFFREDYRELPPEALQELKNFKAYLRWKYQVDKK